MRQAPELRALLLDWYDEHRRRLPWREQPTPYRVLVSELMLQQTQVATVLPYFERWMARFPDLRALSEASIDEVLSLWAGLGYYRRAHHLHATARTVAARFNAELPTDFEVLRSLPGLGPYTAAAVASIAHGQRRALLDGNVERVYCRFFALEGDARRAPLKQQLLARAELLLDPARPGDFNQALMELGATLCQPRQARCLHCPWVEHCAARREGRELELPSPRPKLRRQQVLAVAFVTAPEVLLWRRPDEGLWSGLWDLPQFELCRSPRPLELQDPAVLEQASGALRAFAAQQFGLAVQLEQRLEPVEHTLTHLDYKLLLWRVSWTRSGPGQLTLSKLEEGMGLSALAKKALRGVG
jgi:A/G-specific adenine glycosylase